MNSLQKTLLAAAVGAVLATPAFAANEVKNSKFNNGTLTPSGMDFNRWSEFGSVSVFTDASSDNWAALSYTSNTASQITQAFTLAAGWYSISFEYFLKSTDKASLIAGLFNQSTFTLMGSVPFAGNNSATTKGTFAVTQYLTAGSYLMGFSGNKARVDDVTVAATVAPVPGPIAGAGLPVVLGLMGFAAWRRRQAA